MEHAQRLSKVGVKVIGNFAIYGATNNLMRITESAELRTKIAASIMDVVKLLQLDGLYLRWVWTPCQMMGMGCKSTIPQRNNIVGLIAALSKPLRSTGRLFMMLITFAPLVSYQIEDYCTELMPHVDYFILETNNLAGHWIKTPNFNFDLKITRDAIRVFISKVKHAGFSKKLVVTFNLSILSFQLITPTKDNKLYSVESTFQGIKYSKYLTLPQWCKLARPDSGYKVFINIETQNYAVKEDHIFVFDNVQSLKEKMDWFNAIGVGVHIMNSYADDQKNVCGCGLLPFMRTVAQLLKSNDCEPLPCF